MQDIRRESPKRMEGDNIIYFMIHNSISFVAFFFIAWNLNLFDVGDDSISYLISMEFLRLLLLIFGLSLICSLLIGRILGYGILWIIFNFGLKKKVRTFWHLNTHGMNEINLSYLISTILSSLMFAVGALFVLENKLFGENTLFSLIITYILIKIIIYLFTRVFSTIKL